MKNNGLIVVLSLLVVVLSGITLVYFVGQTVGLSVAPLTAQVGEAVALIKVKGTQGDNAELAAQLKSIDQRLASIESKFINVGRMPQRPAGGAGGGCGSAQPAADANKVYDIKIGDTPVMGSKDAKVTITAFMDLQCPFCTRFYPPVKDVVKEYKGKVNFVMKNYPLSFHQNALGAAKLAFAANEQGKYYEMVELLLNNGAVTTDDKIKEYAQTAGLNYKKLVADLKNNDAAYQKRLDADKAVAEQSAFNGTPTFYINGKKTSARDLASYKTEIDALLAATK